MKKVIQMTAININSSTVPPIAAGIIITSLLDGKFTVRSVIDGDEDKDNSMIMHKTNTSQIMS